MSNYQAVFFDFGDTLIFDHPSIPEGLARFFRNLGLETTTDEVQQARRAVQLFARLADMQKALGDATAEIVTLRDALTDLVEYARSGADPETVSASFLIALRRARELIQYPEGVQL